MRIGEINNEKPAIMDDSGIIYDCSSWVDDWQGENRHPEFLNKLAQKDITTLPVIKDTQRIGAPVGRIGKFICVGLNYSDHATESGMELPKEPVLFFKATSAIIGPNDDVYIPRNSHKSDWEVELAVVIGKEAKYISEKDAYNYIAGYTLTNDLSEREFQLERSGQWVKGKSADTFGPIGPFIATKDEIKDPHNLNLWLDVNGERLQNSSTKFLVFKIPTLVSYISQFMSLQPGDIISTGTPSGVGLGLKPPRYLKEGDKMNLGIDGLGEQKQQCKQA
ncbi:MAG: fumarylacetoacetate hydrolase family protein [Niabella sp.]